MERIDLVKTLLLERRKAVRSVRKVLETEREYLPGHPLVFQEAHFISSISEQGTTGTEIANIMSTSLSAVSQMANRLEKKGYIFRQKAAEDKRQTVFYLTETGKALKEAHDAYDEDAYARINQRLAHYSEEELLYLIQWERNAASMYGI